MNIYLDTKAPGIYSIRFSDETVNEEYHSLVKMVIAGKKSVSEIYEFIRKNAPGIMMRNDGQGTNQSDSD